MDSNHKMWRQHLSTATEHVLDSGTFLRGNLANIFKYKNFKSITWMAILIAVVLFFYVWQHMQVVRLGYEVQQLKQQHQHLLNKFYYWKYEMYKVKSLSEIEQIARQKLKMKTPSSNHVIIMKNPSSLGQWFDSWFFNKRI
jgi:cell division protein FtsL